MAGMQDEDKKNYCDILLEFLEVAVHHVLYLRELYPRTSFARRKLYGIPVQVSIHPGVRKYVADVLKATKEVVQKNELKKLSVNVITKDSKIVEKHVIHLTRIENPLIGDPYLTRLESSFRSLYLKQSQALGSMEPLPEECRFSVHVLTTEMGASLLEDDSGSQDFPFILVTDKETKMLIPDILPVSSIQVGDSRLAVYSLVEQK